jgi:mannosyltransferase
MSRCGSWYSPRGAARRRGILLLGILCLAGFLNFLWLGRKSLWIDEIHSYRFAALSPADFRQLVIELEEPNMLLYYLLLRVWLAFGDTEFVLRSLSALAGLAAVAAVYALAERLLGSRVALIAALLLALNPMVIRYAQEARGYTLVMLLVTASTFFFVQGVEYSRTRDWLAYALTSVLAVYSHVFAALVLLAHALSLIFIGARRIPWRGLLITGASITLLLLTSPIGIFIVTRDSSGTLAWVSEPSLKRFVGVFAALAGSRWLLALYAPLCLSALLVTVRKWRTSSEYRTTWYYALLVVWLISPVVIAFAVSMVKPVFVPRYFIMCIPPLAVLVAAGLTRLQTNVRVAVMLTAIVGITTPTLAAYYESDKEEWRAVTDHLIAHADSKDAVLFYTGTGFLAFQYYARRYPSGQSVPTVVFLPAAAESTDSAAALGTFLETIASHHDRLWLILSHANRPGSQRSTVSKSMQEILAEAYSSVNERTFQGIRVRLYDNRAKTAR